MDLFKFLNQVLKPKTMAYFTLMPLMALVFLITVLTTGHYQLKAPLFSALPIPIPPPPPPPSIPHSTHVIPNPAKNQSSVIKDVTLLKNFRRKREGDETDIVRAAAAASCDIFDGRWVVDRYSPRYRPSSCPFVDVAFDCFGNGRPDLNYTRLRWRPRGCRIPRLDGRRMLEMLRGKRLVFVGDSLNRNMWQSLVCILRNSLKDEKRAFEISGRHEFRTEGSYAIKFSDYNCTVEFFRTPFLVQEWQVSDEKGSSKETLRLDVVHGSSVKYKDADFIVFNTAHWWTHEKTSLGKDFYQEGEHVYSQLSAAEAYRKALTTWADWVDTNIDRNRTEVFFRGYSSSHFSGGQWNSGGNCDGETLPIRNDTHLGRYPRMMTILESVMLQMRTPVHYLNITKMTDYRKDGHPSVFRQPEAERQPGAFQDCSHWCLPGVPDAWNELLYAMLLRSVSEKSRRIQ